MTTASSTVTVTMAKGESEHLFDWPNDAGFQAEAEQREPVELHVIGKIPAAASGTLLRTGPALYKTGNFSLSHWFDGFSQVYRFQLDPQPDGTCRVFYNSRRQVDETMERAHRTGRLDNITFGQKRDPCVGFFGKVKTALLSPQGTGRPADTNVGVTIHEPEYVGETGVLRLRTDNAQLKTIDATTLEPVGVTDQKSLHPELTGPLSSAHARFDRETGDCFNYNLAFGRSATYRVFRTDAQTGQTEILATISGPDVRPSYLHSFFLTENFVILCVWPAHFASMGLAMLWERNILNAIAPFDPHATTHWFVVDRRRGRGLVKRFTSPAMFCFHTINAYEEVRADGAVDIIADLDEYANLDVVHRVYYDNIVSNAPGARTYAKKADLGLSRPGLARYRLASVRVDESLLKRSSSSDYEVAERILYIPSPRAGELPTINPRYNAKPHRFVYGVCDRGLSSFFDGLVKTDLKTQDTVYWSHDKHTPGEPIFVVDPERRGKEDGGWLLTCVLDGLNKTSYLLCLDAETMCEVGRAESNVAWDCSDHGTINLSSPLKYCRPAKGINDGFSDANDQMKDMALLALLNEDRE